MRTLLRAEPHPGRHLLPLTAGDDAAVLSDDSCVCVDAMVEGIHFDDRLEPADVGWKLVAVNASDLGAMGAKPAWALLTVSLPRPLDSAWVDAFARGMHEALEHWSLVLIGGDTTASPGPKMLSLTVGSHPVRHPIVGRCGAHPGDLLWVTGELGRASAGFHAGTPAGLAWLRRPRPPVVFGGALAEAGLATSMMDLSDGLAIDLPRLCGASAIGAIVQTEALPRGEALHGVSDPLRHQVAFGEDYELLFTSPVRHREALLALGAAHGVRLTEIGRTTGATDVVLSGRDWPTPDFTHFQVAP